MTTPESSRPWQEALGELYRRAATDADFRQLLMQDPAKAFAAVGNFALPTEVRLRFIEKPEEIVFILPPLTSGDGSISEDELDMVAGGTGIGNPPPFSPGVPALRVHLMATAGACQVPAPALPTPRRACRPWSRLAAPPPGY